MNEDLTSMNCILEAHNIRKVYREDSRENEVLKGVSVGIEKGEIVVILGPSGSGKTTLVHVLGGLDRPDEGSVLLDGTDLFAHSDRELSRLRNREIGFVFQFHQLLPEFTALENVMLPGMIRSTDRPELIKKSTELLDAVELHGKEHRLPRQLSGGERQRVGVARALVNNPKIVFADEPSGNLDADTSKSLHSLFLKLNKEADVTFVIATHKQAMSEIANRIIELQDGRCQGKPKP
jgi:lipoprotein-releasing system ATP-binding protein